MNKKNENLNWYYDGEGSLVNGDKIFFAFPAGGTCPFCGEERYINWALMPTSALTATFGWKKSAVALIAGTARQIFRKPLD